MKASDKKKIGFEIVSLFENEYKGAVCSLDYESGNAYQLLVATRLSAQCTDNNVNKVTPRLFEKYPTVNSLAKADVNDVADIIRTLGLYSTKSKDLVACAKMIEEDFGGTVPDTVEELIKLPGIGRKTANLVCGDIFGKPAVVTDTHFIRLCNRIGFVKTTDPYKVETEMRKILPPERSNGFCHRAVLHGRAVCTARKADCENCCINELCEKNIEKRSKK